MPEAPAFPVVDSPGHSHLPQAAPVSLQVCTPPVTPPMQAHASVFPGAHAWGFSLPPSESELQPAHSVRASDKPITNFIIFFFYFPVTRLRHAAQSSSLST